MTQRGNRFRDELVESIEKTLIEQARKNELIIAYVRATTLVLVAAGDWYAHLHPPAYVDSYPISIPLITTSWGALSVAIVVVFRSGWYRPVTRLVLPAIDGLLIGLALFNLAHSFGPAGFRSINGPTTVAMTCSLFAATGALRLTRIAAAITAGMSILIFLSVTFVFSDASVTTPIHVSMLVGVGLLSWWMTGVVRRAMQSEVGRSTFERFLPTRVVSEAYGDSSKGGAEPLLALLTEPRSIDATVLITDLRGFTSLAETLTPAEALEFLNEIQGELASIVRDTGGTVDKFLGDGMLAVFGAPEPLADHATCAVRAGQLMRRRVSDMNVTRAKLGQKSVKLGIGIHSGVVVAGCLGSGRRLEFTVIGDTVNTASRLEALTKDKGVEVLLSEESLKRISATDRATICGETAHLVSLGEVPIRGRKEPLVMHTIVDGPPGTEVERAPLSQTLGG